MENEQLEQGENLDEQDELIIEDSVEDSVEDSNASEEAGAVEKEESLDDKQEELGTAVTEEKKEVDPVQKRINKVIYEKKLAEEKYASEARIREELQRKYDALTAEVLPDIPPIPDVMDPEYFEKMKARDEIVVRHAQDKAAKQVIAERQQEEALKAHNRELDLVSDMVKSFDARTEELKLNKAELVESQNKVGEFLTGKTELCRYLLSDELGPLNVLYLSQNITELEKISKMPQTDAAVYIATKISVEANKLRPKTTKAPEPHYMPNGKQKAEYKDPNLEGCTFV